MDHNQHVIQWAGHTGRQADAALNKFRFPEGNLATPCRVRARAATARVMLEILRQAWPEGIKNLPEPVRLY